MAQLLWKTVWCLFVCLQTKHTCHTIEQSALLYVPKGVKNYVHTKICTWMFIAALFITARTWKQPRCPSVGEWIDKLWYIQTMEYYSALKRNEL